MFDVQSMNTIKNAVYENIKHGCEFGVYRVQNTTSNTASGIHGGIQVLLHIIPNRMKWKYTLIKTINRQVVERIANFTREIHRSQHQTRILISQNAIDIPMINCEEWSDLFHNFCTESVHSVKHHKRFGLHEQMIVLSRIYSFGKRTILGL